MKPTNIDNFLVQVMNNGFERAASSFSKLINRPVKMMNTQVVLVPAEAQQAYLIKKQGELNLLTTQIIGSISGKSYLILNKDESDEITATNGVSMLSEALNDAFLKEIDNIISASVISEISNALDLDIYGDVPHLMKIPASQLQHYMQTEITKDGSSGMVFCNTSFQIDNREMIQPQFIWKLSSHVLQLIPSNKITV